MRVPSPAKVKRLAARAQEAQNRATVHIQHSHVGNNNEHIRKSLAVSPELGYAARQLAMSKPMVTRPTDEASRDDMLRAHKAMHNATAFFKASKGLKPQGKRLKKPGAMAFQAGKGTQATPRVGAYR